jgi:hypothetical protein
MPEHRNTPVIFLTARNNDDALEAAFAAGGDDFIAKPASPAAIRSRLKARLQRAEYSRRLERLRDGLKQYLLKKTLEVVENLSPTDPAPPPQEPDLAICFTDMRGLPDEMRRFGIGSRAVIGNIGSPEHLDYSAIGSTVNLAARLCGQAQAMSIAVSKAVRDGAAGETRLNFQSKREVVIRGIKDPVTVYTLSIR